MKRGGSRTRCQSVVAPVERRRGLLALGARVSASAASVRLKTAAIDPARSLVTHVDLGSAQRPPHRPETHPTPNRVSGPRAVWYVKKRKK